MSANPTPTVSIIVPNYNHARFLRQRIDTILAQTYQDFELVLLDDCSTDESREILREYATHPRVTHLELNESNSGSTFKQWNKGVGLARGEYVWIAESDDFSDVKFLARMVSLLNADENITIAYCRSSCASESGRICGFADGYVPYWDPSGWNEDFCMSGREMCRRYFCGTNRIPNASSAVFRKDVYERVGGADESLLLSGDWKLWTAMALEGGVAYTAEPFNYFRSHGGSLRSRTGLATAAIELLSISAWVRQRIEPLSPEVLRLVHLVQASAWVRVVLSISVPLGTKRELLRLVGAYDPNPVQSALRFLPRWFAATISRALASIGYSFLNLTYRARHATGLTRNGFAQIRAKFSR